MKNRVLTSQSIAFWSRGVLPHCVSGLWFPWPCDIQEVQVFPPHHAPAEMPCAVLGYGQPAAFLFPGPHPRRTFMSPGAIFWTGRHVDSHTVLPSLLVSWPRPRHLLPALPGAVGPGTRLCVGRAGRLVGGRGFSMGCRRWCGGSCCSVPHPLGSCTGGQPGQGHTQRPKSEMRSTRILAASGPLRWVDPGTVTLCTGVAPSPPTPPHSCYSAQPP